MIKLPMESLHITLTYLESDIKTIKFSKPKTCNQQMFTVIIATEPIVDVKQKMILNSTLTFIKPVINSVYHCCTISLHVKTGFVVILYILMYDIRFIT